MGKKIEKFFNNISGFWTYNDRPVQDSFSDACGYHCIIFSKHRCAGLI